MSKGIGVTLFLTVCLLFTACAESKSIISFIYPDRNVNYGDTGGLTLPLDGNHTKISILIASEQTNLSNKLVVQELSARTGLDIDIMEVPASSIQEKVKVMLSTNDMPDIVNSSFRLDEINQLGSQRIFASVNKYINELPNLKRYFVDDKENSRIFHSFTSQDNQLYVFPKFEFRREVDRGFFYRKDIFDACHIPAWSNTEEFYQAMKKLKELYPVSAPYASGSQTQIFEDWSAGWGIRFPGAHYNAETDSFRYSATEAKAKEMLDFMAQLYQEGLLDEEFLTCSEENWEEKMLKAGQSFASYGAIDLLDEWSEKAGQDTPNYDLQYAYPLGPEGKISYVDDIGIGPAVTNNQKKLLSFKLLDYLLSPSGAELMTLGVQNKTFQVEKDGSLKYLGFASDAPISVQELQERYGMFMEGLYCRGDKRSIFYQYSPREQQAQDLIQREGRQMEKMPAVQFESSQKNQVTRWQTELAAAAMTFAKEYVTGNQRGDAAWHQWLEQAEALGVRELMEIYNAQYQKYKE